MQDLQETETLLGEMASLLSAVADALTENPGRILTSGRRGPDDLVLLQRDWPTYQAVLDLCGQWESQYKRASEIWAALKDRERAALSPPSTAGFNSLAPVV